VNPVVIVAGDFVKTAGMDRANHALAAYCAEQGREVHLVGHRAAGDLLGHPRVAFHRLPKLLNSYHLSEPLLDHVGRWWARRLARRGARVIVNGGNCSFSDVNWVHHIHARDRANATGPWLRRLRLRLYYRSSRAREGRILPKARQLVTTCRRNKQELLDLWDFPEERVRVIYLGTDPDLFRPANPDEIRQTRSQWGWSSNRPYVAFVGALGNRRKGFDTLFQAWARLCQDRAWDADLVVVGRGSELPTWQAKARQGGLGERIHFLGFVKNLPALLAACDAHVLPSRYEGYSLATQEALCCGVPALVTATAGIAERYPATLQDLLIPDPEDVDGVASRLRNWHAHRENYRLATLDFSHVLRAHTWNHMAAEFAALLDQPCN
jgi:glycosyltransferase involved in cell wall biosynthesis